MKSKRLLLMLLLAVFGVARAQVTIGDLETAGNDTYLPMNSLYEYSYSQQIYTADEIGTAGTINAITIWMYGNANLYTIPFDIYMVETDKESFTSTTDWESVTSGDIVYSGSVTVHNTTAEAYTFELDAPFAYSGTGNLLIAFDNNCGQWVSGLTGKVFTATDNVTRSIYVRRDSNDYDPTNMSGITATATTALRNVIEIDITPGGGPSCARPTNFVVSYTGGSTATVTWEGEASLYNIDINGTVTEGVTSPYVMNVLPATTYTVKVQADCGDGLTSGWTGAQSFFTPCEAFDLPYAYGFEDANELNCWNMVYTANTPGIYNGLAYEGNNSFRFSSYSSASSYDQYLISPELNTTNGVDVTFYYAGYSYGSETFKVGYSTTSNDPSAFTWGDQITATGTDWNLYEGSFPAGTKFVGIYYFSNYQYYMYVDDFNFEVPSSCRKPTNLAASEIGPRTATLSWTENGEARSWNLLVNGELIEGVDNPHTLTGLTPETAYTVQVSPVCEVEKWSDAITFTTEVACPAPVLTIVESTPIATTFSWTGEAQGYEMEYMINSTFNFDDGTLQGWTNLMVIDTGGMWKHSNENPGGYDYTTLAHSGTGFALCYSFIDYDGAYNTDAYLISPRSYQINNGASMNFWYDMANDDYPENFEVCVATAANPTAEDFTAIWTSDAKGSNGQKAAVRHSNTRYDNWREATVDLSAYVGQTIWIAFHDVNLDAYEVWIDDVMIDDGTIDWTPAPAPIVSPYTLALEPETEYLVRVRAICGGEDGESAWTTVTVTTPSNCDAPFDLNVTNLMPTTATLNWTGYQDGFEIQYREVGGYSAIWEDGFEDGLGNWTIYTEADVVSGQTQGWYQYDPTNGLSFEAHGGSYVASAWSWTNSTSYTADNWLVSPQLQLQGILRYYVRTNNNYPDNYEVILSLGGNTVADFTDASAITLVELAAAPVGNQWVEVTIDMSEYTGQSGYIAIHQDQYDGNYLLIDDFGLYEITNPGPWTPATSDGLSVDIDELDPETTYEWQVRGENRSCGEEGYTEWSEMGTFTTPGLCDNPNTFVFENLEATTATLTWTGYQESFNVMYRTAETYDELFYDDLEEGIDEWTTPNDDNLFTLSFTDGSSMTCYGFVGDGTTQTLISPEFESAPTGYALRFFYYAYQASIQTFNVGFSTDGENFTYTGEVTTDEENYADYYEVNVPEGAKYFAIQSSGASNYLLLGEFWIYANYVAPGDWVELTVTEPSVTMEPLTPETEYEVYVQGICGEGEDDVTNWIGGYFTTPEQTNITQTIELVEGVNWVSFYVETNLDDLKAALVEASPNASTTNSIIIKSQKNGQTLYNGTRWRGALNALDLASMYQITVPESCEITLEGLIVDPAMHPVTIKNGPNWIAFPFNVSMTPTDAFGDFPVSGDKIQSKSNGQANYTNRWRGALSTLVPGQGYIYNSAASEDKVFTYPSSTSKAAQDVTISLTTGHKSMKDNTTTVLSIKKTSANTTSIDKSFAKDRKE